MKHHLLVFLIALSLRHSQAAPFQNLGFDAANTNNLVDPSGIGLLRIGPAAEMLPGWQLFVGGVLRTQITYNYSPVDNNALIGKDQNPSFVEGPYAMEIGGAAPPITLVQRGDIPADARFISYKVQGNPFTVSVNGVTLPHSFDSSPFLLDTTLSFDISAYAGQNAEIRLDYFPLFGAMNFSNASLIDSVAFLVPEPSTYTLFALGGIGLFFSRHIGQNCGLNPSQRGA